MMIYGARERRHSLPKIGDAIKGSAESARKVNYGDRLADAQLVQSCAQVLKVLTRGLLIEQVGTVQQFSVQD